MGASVQQMADRIAGLMEERLKIGGAGLGAKLQRGGRKLPRKIRAQAQYLADMAELSGHPKIEMMMDHEKVAQAYDACIRYLNPLGARDRMTGALLGVGGSIALALLVVGAGLIAVLVWRGFL